MIKNENLHDNKFISLKRKKCSNSSLLNTEGKFKGKNTKRANKKFHSKKVNYKKFGKYNSLIENFYIKIYGLIRIKQRCASCGVKDFLTNELLYFKNIITLFYYIKYIFHVTKNKFFLDNKIYIENYDEIKKHKKIDFNLKTKFLFPKTICTTCFINLMNKQNLVQNLIIMLKDDDLFSSLEDKNKNINNINTNYINSNEIKNEKDKMGNYIFNSSTTLNNKELKNKKDYQLRDQNIININENINNINNYINGNNIIFNEININDYNYWKNKISSKFNKNNNNSFNNFNNNNNIINDIYLERNNNFNLENYRAKNNDENRHILNSINQQNNDNKISITSIDKDKQIINSDANNLFSKNNYDNEIINNQENIPIQQINLENNINLNINSNIINGINSINEINKNPTRQLFSNQHIEFQNCLIELKSKISEIINVFKQLKNQYYFILNNYPNLSDIIFSYKKSFFLLHYVAESEIISNLVIFQHYINQRIMTIIIVLNYLEVKAGSSQSLMDEIKNLKQEVKELYLRAEENNNIFIYSMNKFLEILKSFWIFIESNENA